MERTITIFAKDIVIGKVAAKDIFNRRRWGGIARLKTGEWVYAFTHESDPTLDRGWIITAEEAVEEILVSKREDLLNLPEFEDLKEIDTSEIRERMNW